jgi:CheY-like chemotaxis protein
MSSPILLCIDDRPELLKLRKETLEPLGYSVATTTDPNFAIKLLEKTPVAAILIDYKSEGMDTIAVALHIKQRFSDKPIVLLSAYSDLPERILWLVDDYVMKSEPLEGLVQVIDRVTGRTGTKKFAPRSDKSSAGDQAAS